jgi:hypothetical protein
MQHHSFRTISTSIRRSPVKAALHLLLLLGIALPFAPGAFAQYRASLRGVVSDATGAVVPGATVTLTNKATNEKSVITSDDSGIYTFNALPPATFVLQVEKQGFKTNVIQEVVIIPEQPNALNVQLEVGAAQQTVTVSGSTAPLLDTENATLGATIDSNQIQHLPSFNRDVFQLAQLTPGVFGDASQAAGGGAYNLPGNQGPGGTSGGAGGIFETENGPQIQTRGGQYETNGITIDGISTVSAVWGGTSVITPSEDSISDVKVVANSYDAESGRFSGGAIEVTSKSGSNSVHGSLFFKASRPGLNAYQRYNGLQSLGPGTPDARGLNRDENRFNQYGGSVGGPIWKNRIFAFFNYEASPLASSGVAQGWYETSQFNSTAAPAGSIAAKFLSYPGEGVSASTIIPSTCSQIGLTEGVNCATVAGGLDVGSPLTIGLGKQDPSYGGSPNMPGVGSGLDGVPDLADYSTLNPTSVSQAQYNGRLDADATSKDHVSFAIYWVPSTTTDFNGPTRVANFWHHSQVNDAFTVIWNHVFSPTLLNQARANAAGWRWNEVATNPQAPFGLPEDNFDNIGTIGPQFLGAPGPSNLNQWTYDYNDVMTKIAGRHNIKFGGDLTRLYYLNNPVYAARPSFGFRNLWDFANDAPYSESGQFDAATGIPFANRQDDRANIWGFFAQDDFKVLPNLTINIGLRWSYFGTFYSKENNLDVLRFGGGANPLDGLNIRVGGGLYSPQKNNLGPEFGFAWLPVVLQNKLVVRGGIGLNYNQNEIAITANGNGNPPNAVQASFCCSTPTSNYPGIQYETAGNINSIFGYAPNLAAKTTFGPDNLPLGTTPIAVTGFDSHPGTISNYHFSLDTEYQMPFNMVATLGYQGSLTHHLLVQYNYNVVAAAQGLALNPKTNFVDYYTNSGFGSYNALIGTLRHDFMHHFSVQAQYTWAKALDQNSGPYSEDYYPYDPAAAYGRSDYNVAHAFKLFGLWQPVIFHGNSALDKVAGGWSLSGIFNLHTGFPWSPFYSAQTSGGLYYNGSGYGNLRPAALSGKPGTSTANKTFEQGTNPNYGVNPTQFFVPPTFVNPAAAFPATAPAPRPGIERNSLNGPGYNDMDASLSKGFGLPNMRVLGENARFEIRGDFYNLFNKTNLSTSSIDTSLGTVMPGGTVPNPNGDFGVARNGLASRTIQLQARFSF